MAIDELIDAVQPIVLVGGSSRRFGRDKLREPVGGGACLVQRPIAALREVFGQRVLLVGACHPDVVPLADGVLEDLYPGIGPMGGLVSALRHSGGPVFVLAGDMPCCTAATVRRILSTLQEHPQALAALAWDGRTHPCVGCYRAASLPILQSRLEAGDYRLSSALPEDRVARAACERCELANINTPRDAHEFVP